MFGLAGMLAAAHRADKERKEDTCCARDPTGIATRQNTRDYHTGFDQKRTWGQVLCGDALPVVTLPEPKVAMRRLN